MSVKLKLPQYWGMRGTSLFTAGCLIMSSLTGTVQAQSIVLLPSPGEMVLPTVSFSPTLFKGIRVDVDNPLVFDFVLDPGESARDQDALSEQVNQLARYFLATLTIPEKDMWVNLSPYESERVIEDAFGATAMGRDLLAQDYLLKQLTASLIHPEDEIGKAFWDKVYQEAFTRYGTTEIPVDTFNKVWIVPDKAVIYEHEQTAFIVESRLKVMLESDYVAFYEGKNGGAQDGVQEMAKEVVREVVVPAIEREVNEGETFAQLRQIYHAMMLATWYKMKIRNSILSQVYVDRGLTAGVDHGDGEAINQIYSRYVEAFKTGVYNFVREEYDEYLNEMIPRKYFSGGYDGAMLSQTITFADAAMVQSAVNKNFLTVRVGANGVSVNNAQQVDPNAWENIQNDLNASNWWEYFSAVDRIRSQFYSGINKNEVNQTVFEHKSTGVRIIKKTAYSSKHARMLRKFVAQSRAHTVPTLFMSGENELVYYERDMRPAGYITLSEFLSRDSNKKTDWKQKINEAVNETFRQGEVSDHFIHSHLHAKNILIKTDGQNIEDILFIDWKLINEVADLFSVEAKAYDDFIKNNRVVATRETISDLILEWSSKRYDEINFSGGSVISSALRGVVAGRLDFGHARIVNAIFDYVEAKEASFRGATFAGETIFQNMDVSGFDFEDADLTGVRFINVTGLEKANFKNATLPAHFSLKQTQGERLENEILNTNFDATLVPDTAFGDMVQFFQQKSSGAAYESSDFFTVLNILNRIKLENNGVGIYSQLGYFEAKLIEVFSRFKDLFRKRLFDKDTINAFDMQLLFMLFPRNDFVIEDYLHYRDVTNPQSKLIELLGRVSMANDVNAIGRLIDFLQHAMQEERQGMSPNEIVSVYEDIRFSFTQGVVGIMRENPTEQTRQLLLTLINQMKTWPQPEQIIQDIRFFETLLSLYTVDSVALAKEQMERAQRTLIMGNEVRQKAILKDVVASADTVPDAVSILVMMENYLQRTEGRLKNKEKVVRMFFDVLVEQKGNIVSRFLKMPESDYWRRQFSQELLRLDQVLTETNLHGEWNSFRFDELQRVVGYRVDLTDIQMRLIEGIKKNRQADFGEINSWIRPELAKLNKRERDIVRHGVGKFIDDLQRVDQFRNLAQARGIQFGEEYLLSDMTEDEKEFFNNLLGLEKGVYPQSVKLEILSAAINITLDARTAAMVYGIEGVEEFSYQGFFASRPVSHLEEINLDGLLVFLNKNTAKDPRRITEHEWFHRYFNGFLKAHLSGMRSEAGLFSPDTRIFIDTVNSSFPNSKDYQAAHKNLVSRLSSYLLFQFQDEIMANFYGVTTEKFDRLTGDGTMDLDWWFKVYFDNYFTAAETVFSNLIDDKIREEIFSQSKRHVEKIVRESIRQMKDLVKVKRDIYFNQGDFSVDEGINTKAHRFVAILLGTVPLSKFYRLKSLRKYLEWELSKIKSETDAAMVVTLTGFEDSLANFNEKALKVISTKQNNVGDSFIAEVNGEMVKFNVEVNWMDEIASRVDPNLEIVEVYVADESGKNNVNFLMHYRRLNESGEYSIERMELGGADFVLPGVYREIFKVVSQDVPLVNTLVENTETIQMVIYLESNYFMKRRQLTHSQIAGLTKLGRLRSSNFLLTWSDANYDMAKHEFYSINLNLIPEISAQLIEKLNQAKEIEMAYFDAPQRAGIKQEQQQLWRQKYNKETVQQIRRQLIDLRNRVDLNGLKDVKNQERLLRALDFQTDRLNVIADQAMSNVGGIDFDAGKMNMEVRGDGFGGVEFNIDPAQIEQMNIRGFEPVILNISPATNLPMMLGLNDESYLQES